MRLLKFRVWDKELNKFDSPNVHHLIKNNGILSIGLNLDIQKICGDGRFVIQQFTGLKDKNGVEIYEGDIIKIDSHLLPEKVIFMDGQFGMHFNYKNCVDPRRKDNDPADFYSLFDFVDIAAIVGNVFEHPELLEKL